MFYATKFWAIVTGALVKRRLEKAFPQARGVWWNLARVVRPLKPVLTGCKLESEDRCFGKKK